MIRGAKTIAEYAFRRWMQQAEFVEEYFQLEMVGEHECVIRDRTGDELRLLYDPGTKKVRVM